MRQSVLEPQKSYRAARRLTIVPGYCANAKKAGRGARPFGIG
jgi:hypothetical protein